MVVIMGALSTGGGISGRWGSEEVSVISMFTIDS